MASISMLLMAILTTFPQLITDIPTRYLMDLGATWEERCQLLREEIGLNVLLQLGSEGTYLGFPPFASSEPRVITCWRR